MDVIDYTRLTRELLWPSLRIINLPIIKRPFQVFMFAAVLGVLPGVKPIIADEIRVAVGSLMERLGGHSLAFTFAGLVIGSVFYSMPLLS